MSLKILSLFVCALLINLLCYAPVAADSKTEKEAEFAAKVKTAVVKLGTGLDARVMVKLRDKTKIKGYVSEVQEKGFVVVNDKTGTSTQILYSQVKSVKGRNNLTGVQIGIIAAVVVLIVIGVLYGLDKIE